MCYPPGIPILAPGERVTKKILDYIRYAKEKGCQMTGTEDAIQNGLFSKMYGSVASAATPWYFSLLYILVAADSRYITGLAPALVPLDPKDELMIVWERSYILSGGLARFALLEACSWI